MGTLYLQIPNTNIPITDSEYGPHWSTEKACNDTSKLPIEIMGIYIQSSKHIVSKLKQ
jgi:hypothetical protein